MEIIRSLREIGPHILTGFAGVVAWVAQAVDPTDLSGIHLRFIAVDSEALTPLIVTGWKRSNHQRERYS
jgi:hypothetical protein